MLDKTLIGWFPFDVTTRTQKVLEVCYNLIILFIGEVFDDFFSNLNTNPFTETLIQNTETLNIGKVIETKVHQ